MNWRRRIDTSYAFFLRSYIFTIRNLFSFFEVLFFPLVGLVSVGLLGKFLSLSGVVQSFILVGAMTAGVLQVTQLDVSYGLLYDVWSKSIKQTFLAPVSIYEAIFGSFLFGIVRGLSVFLLLCLVSSSLFSFSLPDIAATLVFLSGVFLFALLTGTVVHLSILLFGQRIDIIAWSISVIAMLLCGIYYPVTILPSSLVFLSSLIPLTYFLEYMRSFYGFSPHFHAPIAKGFCLCVLYILALFMLLHLAVKKGKRTGMFLRMSE